MVVKRHVRALTREREPDGPPEPLAGTRDQHDLIAQGEIHSPPRRRGVWRLAARLTLPRGAQYMLREMARRRVALATMAAAIALVVAGAGPVPAHHVGTYVPRDNDVSANFKQLKFSLQARKFEVAGHLFETGAAVRLAFADAEGGAEATPPAPDRVREPLQRIARVLGEMTEPRGLPTSTPVGSK